MAINRILKDAIHQIVVTFARACLPGASPAASRQRRVRLSLRSGYAPGLGAGAPPA
jgi:hypothetical protein